MRPHVLVAAAIAILGGTAARAELGAAYRAGDVDALRRAGADGDDVRSALHARDRAGVLGAIVAAEAAPDPWELLGPLAVVAAGWDRATAAPAARASARIARGLDGEQAILDDLPDDRLEEIAAAWAALATRPDRWSDVRVHALEVATHAARARAATAEVAPDVDAMLLAAATDDDDPQVRRAALELMTVPAEPATRPALVARLIGDAAIPVRLAAAQVLCAAVPADGDAVLAALGADGLAALRAAVATPPRDSGGALLDAVRCLTLDPDPRSQRAVTALRQAAPRPLRAAVARVAADVRARAAEASAP